MDVSRHSEPKINFCHQDISDCGGSVIDKCKGLNPLGKVIAYNEYTGVLLNSHFRKTENVKCDTFPWLTNGFLMKLWSSRSGLKISELRLIALSAPKDNVFLHSWPPESFACACTRACDPKVPSRALSMQKIKYLFTYCLWGHQPMRGSTTYDHLAIQNVIDELHLLKIERTWWPGQPMSSTLPLDSCLSQWQHSWHGLLDRPSAFLCCAPGRYWISKLYSLRTCNHRQSCPSGFLKLMSHRREPWSIRMMKWRPYKLWWKCFTAVTTARSSLRVTQYCCSVQLRALL